MICIKIETQKIVNLLNNSDNESSRFATRKWYIINDQNNGQYGRGNENELFLYDYSDAYVLVTGDIKIADIAADTNVAFNTLTANYDYTHIDWTSLIFQLRVYS